MGLHLVIGGRGLIGTALCGELSRRGFCYLSTTRQRPVIGPKEIYLDLNDVGAVTFTDQALSAEFVYLVAGFPGFSQCARRGEDSWRLNVDAPVELAYKFKNSFLTFISSDSVMWDGQSAYARQKTYVEHHIRHLNGAIFRPGKVTPDNVRAFCSGILRVSLEKKSGVTVWQ